MYSFRTYSFTIESSRNYTEGVIQVSATDLLRQMIVELQLTKDEIIELIDMLVEIKNGGCISNGEYETGPDEGRTDSLNQNHD